MTANVLVYNRDASERAKQKQARAWIDHLWATRSGRLSYQVLVEFYVTVTVKLDPGLDPEAAENEVRELCTWQPVVVDWQVLEGAWSIRRRFSLSWWDALIVEAAKMADCRYLLTEDLQSGQDLGGLEVVNPFKTTPEALADRSTEVPHAVNDSPRAQ